MSDEIKSPPTGNTGTSISRTIWPARIVLVILGLFAFVSLALFVYQVQLETYPGSGQWFVGTTMGALHVSEHLIRGFASLVLAICTWRYLRLLKGSVESSDLAMQKTLVMLWRAFAASLLLFVAFGIGNVIAINSASFMNNEPEEVVSEEPIPKVAVELRLAGNNVEDVAIEAPVAGRNYTVWLHTHPLLTNDDIAKAVATTRDGDPDGNVELELEFTSQGAAILKRASNLHIGRNLAFVLDGEVVMAPRIDSPISTRAVISLSGYSLEDAKRLAREIVSQRPR